MNTLSWLIYAADVSGKLSGLLGITGGLAMIAIILLSIFSAIDADMGKGPAGEWKRKLRWGFVPFIFWIALVLLPSKTTILAIAASEAGETIVTSPDNAKILTDIRALIQKRLSEELADNAE